MKDLFDIYTNECDGGLNATPLNTIGMGNPTPPTDGQMGSEPMCGKCKKEKSKKKNKIHTEPEIKEGLLGDMEDNLTAGDNLVKSVNETFEKIKTLVCNKSKWAKTRNSKRLFSNR